MNIATTLRYVNLNDGSIWNERYYIMNDYMLMAKKYGVGLLAVMTEHDIERICEQCDGLIIPGSGSGIDPKYYGGAPRQKPLVVDEYYLDAKLIKYFYEAKKPIFGICGGHEAINIYFGGTIDKVPDKERHSDSVTHTHPINIEKDSFVFDVFKTDRYTVNSHHGWWDNKIAPDFRAVAVTDDGIVEAIENKKARIYATQWHPEQSFHTGDSIENKFFENFLRECERK